MYTYSLKTPLVSRSEEGYSGARRNRGRNAHAALVVFIALVLVAVRAPLQAQPRAVSSPSPQDLAALWDREHVSPPVPPLMDHREVTRRLDALRHDAPDLYKVGPVGASVEGRAINLVTAGEGAFRVMLWSQMHGDEPTATAALFDVFEYLRRHREEPVAERILANLTLYVIPMLNPDGAERFQRRNAQGIDINRDALLLQTPEGRALKAVRDEYEPSIGFNLHNQNWRTSVGRNPAKAASISLLSVSFDEARTENEGRRLTKQTCAIIRDALEPLAPGQIGRYDEEFEVRAFGDNITLWGTPVVLIETGAYPAREPDPSIVRMNFVAILTALDALATGRVREADPQRYESLPMNDSRMFYTLVRGASILTGTGVAPFTGDIGVVASRRVKVESGQRRITMTLNVDDLGDLRVFNGLEEIDGRGMFVIPLTSNVIKEGAIAKVSFDRIQSPQPIAVGQPASFALLKPTSEPDTYTVVRVIR